MLRLQSSDNVKSTLGRVRPNIVFTGGGTAGHVLPNLALIPHIRESFSEIHYVGSKEGIERRLVAEFNGEPQDVVWSATHTTQIAYHAISTGKIRRSLSPKSVLSNLMTPFRVLKGLREANKILREIKPAVVFSKGGFVAYPVVRAAAKQGIAVILHESDLSLGLANRASLKYASIVLASFERTARDLQGQYPNKKILHVGSPIREELYKGSRGGGVKFLAIGENSSLHMGMGVRRNLLVMGGSLGASAINKAVRESLGDLGRDWDILHVVGRGKMAKPQDMGESTTHTIQDVVAMRDKGSPAVMGGGAYRQVEYLSGVGEMADALSWADVVLSRAGAGAVFEILALRKPSLLIPLATGRGDQIENAREVESWGVARVLLEENLNSIKLAKELDEVWKNRENLIKKMRALPKIDGAREVATILKDFV